MNYNPLIEKLLARNWLAVKKQADEIYDEYALSFALAAIIVLPILLFLFFAWSK